MRKSGTIILLTIAALVAVAVLAIPSTRSRQEVAAIDYEAACAQCKADAWAAWDQCWRVYNDEGDSDCRHQREDALVACETQYCVFITQSQPRDEHKYLVNVFAPTASAEGLSPTTDPTLLKT